MGKSRAVFPFEFVIMLGDNLYTGSQPSDYEKGFAAPYKPLLDADVLFYATLGNHDKTNERFYKPFNMNGANYYAYRKGQVHFFALDSNYMDPKQVAWLETKVREGDLAPSAITANGFDTDRSFMRIEFAGDDMYFQTTSRTGVAVDSGVIHRTIRPAPDSGARR